MSIDIAGHDLAAANAVAALIRGVSARSGAFLLVPVNVDILRERLEQDLFDLAAWRAEHVDARANVDAVLEPVL